MNMASQRHVGQNGHTREKFNVLESSADAHTYKFVGMLMGNVFSVEYYSALLGAVKTGYTIEKACFTRSIGADNRHQLAGVNFKINIFDGNNSAKAQT